MVFLFPANVCNRIPRREIIGEGYIFSIFVNILDDIVDGALKEKTKSVGTKFVH